MIEKKQKFSTARIIIKRLAKKITMVKFGLLIITIIIVIIGFLLGSQLNGIKSRLTSIERQQYINSANFKEMERYFSNIDIFSVELKKSQVAPTQKVLDNALKYQVLKTVYTIKQRLKSYTNIRNELTYLHENLPQYQVSLQSLQERYADIASDDQLLTMIDGLTKHQLTIDEKVSFFGKIKKKLQEVISVKTQAEYEDEQTFQQNISLLKDAIINKDYDKAIKLSLALKLSQNSLTKMLAALKYRYDLKEVLETIFTDNIQND